MSQSIDARIQRSSAAIVQAAMVALNNNPEASLKDIAHEAGVGRATLYRLFDSKERLVDAIIGECLTTFDDKTAHIEHQAGSGKEAIQLLFSAILPLHNELQFLMGINELTIKNDELLHRIKMQKSAMLDLVESAKKEGSVANNVPSDWVVNLIDGILYSAWAMRQTHKYTDAQLTQLCFDSLFNGVKPLKKTLFS
jgi:AcrR family transcriptional regulator